MSREDSAGLNVSNKYGPVPVPDIARGVIKTEGGYNEMVIELSGQNINDNLTAALNTLPSGIRFVEWYIEVQEAFVATGTSPTLLVGTNGTEVTNGFVISETILEATGVSVISTTFAGTWATTLTADTEVGLAIGGSVSPTITAGHARIVARYIKV